MQRNLFTYALKIKASIAITVTTSLDGWSKAPQSIDLNIYSSSSV